MLKYCISVTGEFDLKPFLIANSFRFHNRQHLRPGTVAYFVNEPQRIEGHYKFGEFNTHDKKYKKKKTANTKSVNEIGLN